MQYRYRAAHPFQKAAMDKVASSRVAMTTVGVDEVQVPEEGEVGVEAAEVGEVASMVDNDPTMVVNNSSRGNASITMVVAIATVHGVSSSLQC